MSTDNAGLHGTALPSDAELADLSRDELVKLGAKLDGVEIISYPDPWPVKGTKAEKRAERTIALWLLFGALSGLAFLVAFVWWPWEYKPAGQQGWYRFYTPVLGVTLGFAVLSLGVAAILYTKKFIPHELAVQDRHDGGSSELDKATILAELADAGNRSTIVRRSMITRTAGLAAGVVGLGAAVLPLGGLIRSPWTNPESENSLWHTGWKPLEGHTVLVRKDNGLTEEVELVRPEDMDAGSMQTVFPFQVPKDLVAKVTAATNPVALKAAMLREDSTDHKVREEAELLWEKNAHALKRSDTPVMLIRLRPADAQHVIKRPGQESFNYGEYYAYTKICSHLGCPTSLYEQQTNRILCPCHQSQFSALEYAKPLFGPATRPLAQLPITVDERGYFVATSDFTEAIGPAFWERKNS
jgi:ubiquinol-cytochrome c reductase iron-sulfur subunit